MDLSYFVYGTIFFGATVFVLPAIIFIINNRTRINIPPSPPSLPIIGHLHLLDPFVYRAFHNLTRQYGPLISLRLGSVPCIITSSTKIAKEILMTNDHIFASRHDTIVVKYLTYNSSGFTFAAYGQQWKYMKKVCMSGLLGTRALAQLKHARSDELRHFVNYLTIKANACEVVNLSEELVKVSNNIICQMMLSVRYSGTKNQADEARMLTREVTQIFGAFNPSDFIWFLRNIDLQGLMKRTKDTFKRFDTLLEEIMKERELQRKFSKIIQPSGKSEGQVKDFLDTLLDIMEDENAEYKLTRDNVKAFVLDIFTTGTDTSAAATEWAISELINNPDKLEKAREEINLIVGKTRLVEESDLSDLPYIQSIFKESLRLHPPVPLIVRKSIQDCKINGYDIPADTRVFVNVASICRDSKVWEEPLEFRPERFMSQGSTDVKGQHFSLLPFGTGRRGCPGMWLTLQQVPLVMAGMIQCFDWKIVGTASEQLDMSEHPGLTLHRANPLKVFPIAHLRL